MSEKICKLSHSVFFFFFNTVSKLFWNGVVFKIFLTWKQNASGHSRHVGWSNLFLGYPSLHPFILPIIVNATSLECLEGSPFQDELCRSWWLKVRVTVTSQNTFYVQKSGIDILIITKFHIKFLIGLNDEVITFYIQKVQGNLHSEIMLMFCKNTLLGIIQHHVLGKKGTLWKYFKFGWKINWWHYSGLPTLKIWWLHRASVLPGWRCM